MLTGIWSVLGSVASALVVGVAVLAACGWFRLHIGPDGRFSKERMASILALSASMYTFGVLVSSQLIFSGPAVHILIRDGFGDERIAWLLSAIVFDLALRFWDILYGAVSAG